MPIYLYQVVLEGEIDGPVFEVDQPISAPALTRHPVTGHPVRRIYQAPTLTTHHSERTQKQKTSNESVEKAGFTKYERDRTTGRYHKTAGRDPRAPDSFTK